MSLIEERGIDLQKGPGNEVGENVVEIFSGAEWSPRGGEILVESFMPDDAELVPAADGVEFESESARRAAEMLRWSLEDARMPEYADGRSSFPNLSADFRSRFFARLAEVYEVRDPHDARRDVAV